MAASISVDFGVLVVATIESVRRHLLRMEHAAQHVGVRHADPLQREQLEVPFEHVRIQGREFVGADVEIDADLFQILLDDRGLKPNELVGRYLQRQPEARLRSVAVGIAVAGFVENARREDRGDCRTPAERPRSGKDADRRSRQAAPQVSTIACRSRVAEACDPRSFRSNHACYATVGVFGHRRTRDGHRLSLGELVDYFWRRSLTTMSTLPCALEARA